MFRHFLRWLVHSLLSILCRLEVVGLENIPEQGGMIIAVNHLGRLDPALGFAVINRDDLTVLAAEKYQTHLLFKWAFRLVPGIFINRGEADLSALRQARQFLNKGGLLGVAPEGTRSNVGGLIEAKTGVAYLADKARLPVIPTAITGTESAVLGIVLFRRPPVKIVFGRPFVLPPLDRQDRSEALQRNTDEIMCQIAALLPAKYRGVYLDHPRLKELLEDREMALEEV